MNFPLRSAAFLFACCLALPGQNAADLESSFKSPPDEARPWVFWFWINGNISREGITKDLESMKRVGIGGVKLPIEVGHTMVFVFGVATRSAAGSVVETWHGILTPVHAMQSGLESLRGAF